MSRTWTPQELKRLRVKELATYGAVSAIMGFFGLVALVGAIGQAQEVQSRNDIEWDAAIRDEALDTSGEWTAVVIMAIVGVLFVLAAVYFIVQFRKAWRR